MEEKEMDLVVEEEPLDLVLEETRLSLVEKEKASLYSTALVAEGPDGEEKPSKLELVEDKAADLAVEEEPSELEPVEMEEELSELEPAEMEEEPSELEPAEMVEEKAAIHVEEEASQIVEEELSVLQIPLVLHAVFAPNASPLYLWTVELVIVPNARPSSVKAVVAMEPTPELLHPMAVLALVVSLNGQPPPHCLGQAFRLNIFPVPYR